MTFTSLEATAQGNFVESIAELAIESAGPTPLDTTEWVHSLVIPEGAKHLLIDTEEHAERPRRKHGAVKLTDVASLARYVTRHHAADETVLYADIDTFTVVAVLNDDSTDQAAWSDHRATMKMAKTPAWRRWEALNNQMVTQTQFAEHIEASLPDIREPSGAQMLELAQSFQAHTSVRFESAKHLTSGQRQLIYSEDTTASAGVKGDITIPAEFTLGLAPFEGTDPYEVIARLRYRIGNGNLTIGYALDRPEDILRAAFNDALEILLTELDGEGCTTLLLRGTPRTVTA